MDNIKYIEKEQLQKINDADDLVTVIGEYVTDLTAKRGSKQSGTCPNCNKKKLEVNTEKKIYKCFYSGCEVSGKSSIKFLEQTQGLEFVAAAKEVAKLHKITLTAPKQPKGIKSKGRGNRKQSFRDKQLLESGIKTKSISYNSKPKGDSKTQFELSRYTVGTFDKYFNLDLVGDDMILHYINLDNTPMTYVKVQNGRKVGKPKPYMRVRWSNPELHKNKKGDSMKYQSPWGSKSMLWFPQILIRSYAAGEIHETLYIIEGEKKADAMCQAGLMAVGIGGIHNFNFESMPHQFEILIKRFSCTNIVFVLDSDWTDISITKNKHIDHRPKGFFSAVLKFKNYFRAFINNDIDLNIYFSHGKDAALKGIDDLLVRGKVKAAELIEDFKKARIDREGKGEYVNVYDITESSPHKIKKFWHLHDKQAFAAFHSDKLKELNKFKFGNVEHKLNAQGQMEMTDQILPFEQFWSEEEIQTRNDRVKKIIKYKYQPARHFLKNRGYGRFAYEKDAYRFIHMNGRLVKEVDHIHIQDYVQDYTEQLGRDDVLEILLQGGSQYIGPDKLMKMYTLDPVFMEPEREKQYMIFKNCFWAITAEGVTQHKLSDLPGYIWKEDQIDFEPTLSKKPMLQADIVNEKWQFKMDKDLLAKCDMAQFYFNTSNFHWRKQYDLKKNEEGVLAWQIKSEEDLAKPENKVTVEELRLQQANVMSKMIGAGYMLNTYMDYSDLRAVIAMDGEDAEVGKSKGGTGKGIFGTQFEQICHSFNINGKRRKLFDDDFLYEGVTERTRVVWFEDVRPNFDFKELYPVITKGLWVNGKGIKKFFLPARRIYIDTNHAINGDDTSTVRRQYFINFSDYYNEYRRVGDEFGHQFFNEWDNEQWNLFFNWIALCQQMYLKFGMKHKVNEESIARRRVRQQIGEEFIRWADLQFSQEPDESGALGPLLNKKLEKNWAMERYLDTNGLDRKWLKTGAFKDKMIAYAKYANLNFNPEREKAKDKRIRNNGDEYIVLADKNYEAQKALYIKNDAQLADALHTERKAREDKETKDLFN